MYSDRVVSRSVTGIFGLGLFRDFLFFVFLFMLWMSFSLDLLCSVRLMDFF